MMNDACAPRAAQVQLLLYLIKSRIEAKNERSRTVRTTDVEGKVETKTVREYDLDAVNTLFMQAMIVRARAQHAHTCGEP